MIKKFFIVLAGILLVSCSLNYGSNENFEDSVPEFSFTNASFNRFENNMLSINLKAELLEQYKSDGSSYAKNANFKTFDKDGILDTEGSCLFMGADTNQEQYSMFDSVNIKVYSQELTINASSLYFDGKSEQLVSGIAEEVSIKRKDTSITGTGFSASGVSNTFSFNQNISGTVTENPEKYTDNENELSESETEIELNEEE